MVRRMRIAVAVAGAALVAAAWGGAAAGPPAGPRVEISHHKYSPVTLTVAAGTTVTWTNHDDDVHTVVSTDQAFRSPGLETDEAYSYTFARPGTYSYFCTLHPLMVAKVIVK
jgi:plastocyanin